MFRASPAVMVGRIFKTVALVGLVVALGGFSLEKLFAPNAKLIPYWMAEQADSDTVIDHSPFADFLTRYRELGTDGVAMVQYGAVTKADHDSLRDYLNTLYATNPTKLNRAEQFAFWVNLYNAKTIDVILHAYPVDSITDISSGFLSNGPWGKTDMTIEGQKLSLNDIEHGILRPIWQDPRIHYVVNCASIGCPDLPPEPLTSANAEAQLDAGARAYLNHPRGINRDADGLIASKIFLWFAEDFGDLAAHWAPYLDKERAAALGDLSDVDDYRYDWALNDRGDS